MTYFIFDFLDDLDAKKSEEAAVKIQSGYRGYVARKEVEAMKASKSDEKAPEHDGMCLNFEQSYF